MSHGGKPVLAFPNYVDSSFYTVSFSGGSWQASLPLSNLADPLLAKVARSTSASLVNAQFDIDLGAPRPMRVFAIPRCNLSRNALIRIRGSTTAGSFGSPVYDSGWVDVWTRIYEFGSLPWGHPSFWDGKLDSESALDYDVAFIHVASTITGLARYWRWEIDDTANADGYVELARLFMTSGWIPTRGIRPGDALGVLTDTQVERSLGGVDYFERQNPRRLAQFALAMNDVNEVYSNAFEMMRRQGVDRQVYYIRNADDSANLHRTSFLATMRALSPIEFPYHDQAVFAGELQEVL